MGGQAVPNVAVSGHGQWIYAAFPIDRSPSQNHCTTTTMKFRTKPGATRHDRTAVKRRLLVESLCERRVLAAITGVVFDDANETWRFESSETSLAQRLVFVDENNNGLPDDGEDFRLTESDGTFSFEELGGDEQIVRLLTNARTQIQHFPIAPAFDSQAIDLRSLTSFASAGSLHLSGEGVVGTLMSDTGLITLDLAGRAAVEINLQVRPSTSALLPDGRWLVLASDLSGNHAFTLESADSIAPVNLWAAAEGDDELPPEDFTGWASVAIDSDGHGVLVPKADADAPVALRRLTASEQLTTVSTSTVVAAGTQAIGGGSVTTLLAEPNDQGLALSLWSNSTGTLISQTAVIVPGAQSILGYSDSTGLVYAWVPAANDDSSPSVVVLDAAANFQTLQTISELDEMVAVDLQRSVVFSLSTGNPLLRAIDAISSHTLARWPLLEHFQSLAEIPAIGELMEIAIAPGGDALVVLTYGGIATLSLSAVDAHRIRTDASTSLFPLRFATGVNGANTSPQFESAPQYVVTQGVPFVLAEGGLKAAAYDVDEDPFVVVRNSAPANGTVVITPGGAMTYIADANFIGTDSFEIFLHDGHGVSEIVSVELSVVPPVVQTPEILIQIYPVPENAQPGFVAGAIQIIGMGGGPFFFEIDDPRFIVVDDLIIVVEGAELDYEDQYFINANISVTNAQGTTISSSFRVELSDQDDPIEDIQPRSASVFENVTGESLAELTVIDQDADQQFILTVDDDRFEIFIRALRLKPGISLDYEVSPEVVVNVTATDAHGGGNSLTVPFTITVINVAEQVNSVALTNRSVLEYVRGATIGTVSVDGNPIGDSVIVSVDDSRFEIVDGVLQLREGEFLNRADQQEAQVVITAQDVGQVFAGFSQIFIIEVLPNENPFFNSDSPFDVNGDGIVTPLDALLILNAMSQNGGGGSISQFPRPGLFWDVNGDGQITPLDALLILHFINRQNHPPVVGEPESVEPESAVPEPTPGMDAWGSDSDMPIGRIESDVDPRAAMTQRAFDAALLADFDAIPTPADLRQKIDAWIPQNWRSLEISEIFERVESDLNELRDQLISKLSTKDWDLLERLERTLRRNSIDDAAIQAIDRALLTINGGLGINLNRFV